MRQLCRLGLHAKPRLIVRRGALKWGSCPSCGAELTFANKRWSVPASSKSAPPGLTALWALAEQPSLAVTELRGQLSRRSRIPAD